MPLPVSALRKQPQGRGWRQSCPPSPLPPPSLPSAGCKCVHTRQCQSRGSLLGAELDSCACCGAEEDCWAAGFRVNPTQDTVGTALRSAILRLHHAFCCSSGPQWACAPVCLPTRQGHLLGPTPLCICGASLKNPIRAIKEQTTKPHK